jgi:hypothetical protein
MRKCRNDRDASYRSCREGYCRDFQRNNAHRAEFYIDGRSLVMRSLSRPIGTLDHRQITKALLL